MKTRVITGLIFLLVVLAFVVPSFWVPHLMIIFSMIVSAFTTYELIKALKAGGNKPCTKLIIAGDVLTYGCIVFGIISKNLFFTVAVWTLLILMLCLYTSILPQLLTTDVGKSLHNGVISGASIIYLNFPLFCLTLTAVLGENGWYYMVPALFAPWVTDTCAYFTGVLFGKHKIVPHISPKKTWEGCIGGAFFSGVFFVLYFGIFVFRADEIDINRIGFMIMMFLFGLLISAMSQIGDWLASSIKRTVGIKDYGKLMPGHGGMLDRFDSAFFTMPFSLVFLIVSYIIKVGIGG